MKKSICLLLALLLSLGLCACGESEPVYTNPTINTSSASSTISSTESSSTPSSEESSSTESSLEEVSSANSSTTEASSEKASSVESSSTPSSSEESSSAESSSVPSSKPSSTPSSSVPSSSVASSSKPSSTATPSSKPASTTNGYFNSATLSYLSGLDANGENYWFGSVKDEHNRPNGAMQFQTRFQDTQNLACIAPLSTDGQKKIYLTFDMGWEYDKSFTVKILDTLKAKGVKAVFFITQDYAEDSADMVRRMIAEGHIVGNHTVNHPQMSTVSIDRMAKEIMDLHNYVLNTFGYEMFLFRAPSGNFSEKVLGVCKSLGYKNVFWSFAYADWDVNNQPDTEKSYDLYMNCMHDGGIFLIHGISKTNVDILGRVIDGARSKGFEPTLYNFKEVQKVS